MGHSIIEYRGKAEVVPDADAVLMPFALRDAALAAGAAWRATPQVQELLDAWRSILEPYGPGCIDWKLDEFVSDDADRASLTALLRFTADRLRRMGPTLPASYLNQLVDAPEILHFEDRGTESLLACMTRISSLLHSGQQR